jgi:hypothetical protein
MKQRDIVSLIDDEGELLVALGAWARDKTMEERAAKVMRMTIAIGKVPLFVATGRERWEAGKSRPNAHAPLRRPAAVGTYTAAQRSIRCPSG